MQHNLVKEIISLDKQARQKIDALKEKKENLGQVIKKEVNEIEHQLTLEIETKIKETKIGFEASINEKEKKELELFQETLKKIKDRYTDNKDLWIKDIYENCKK